MPGPGQKGSKSKVKRTKKPALRVGQSPEEESFFGDIENSRNWHFAATSICNQLSLDLDTKHGLKKVHLNFDSIASKLDRMYETTFNQGSPVSAGGVVAVYSKMCIDSILRSKLVRRGLLKQLMPLLEHDASRQMAAQCLVNITHHGGLEERKTIAQHCTAALIRLMKQYPDDEKFAELAVVTLGHAVHVVIDGDESGPKSPYPEILRQLDVKDTLETVARAFVRYGKSAPSLAAHALELLAAATYNAKKEILSIPIIIPIIVSGLRAREWTTRCLCASGLLRMYQKDEQPDRPSLDLQKLVASSRQRWPDKVADVFMNYGMEHLEINAIVQATVKFQKTMMQVAKDHNYVTCGIKISENILSTEYGIADGYFQGERGEIMDIGLPFVRYMDALPVCAKAIRETNQNLDAADVLDIKYLIAAQDIPAASALAQKALTRNPQFAYSHYAMSLVGDAAEGLKSSKKGLKCRNSTPFVRFQLMQRAVEHSGLLGITRLSHMPPPGHVNWEEGIAFLVSALEDAKVYIREAPPDCRQMAGVLYWQIILTVIINGPECPTDLYYLRENVERIGVCDAITERLGNKPSQTAIRRMQSTIMDLYESANTQYGEIIANLRDSEADHSDIPFDEKAEDDIAGWLTKAEEGHDNTHVSHDATGRSSVEPSTGMYRCSFCGNPSAILRKCSGCAETRYCDKDCQKQHWSEHKRACVSKS